MAGATVRLGQLCELITDPVRPGARPNAMYLGLEHIAPGRLVRISCGQASDMRSNTSAFRAGDVLYGKLRPYLDKAVLSEEAGVCTTELLVLRSKADVDPRFLAALIHSPGFVEYAIAGTTGVQHPRTSWAHIKEFEAPALALDEQHKIADLIWLVHEGISQSEKLVKEAYALKRAAMRTLFTHGLRGEEQKQTEIGPVPESWELGSICDYFTVVSGGTPSRQTAEFWVDGKIPWVKTTEIDYRVIEETDEYITQAGLNQSSVKLLPPGTLLLAMYGQGVTRGKVAILGVEGTCNQACAALIPNSPAVEVRYLYHFLTFRYESIRQQAHGGQQQNLNLEIVRNLPITIPVDKETQHEVVTILDNIDYKINLHRRKSDVQYELFKKLLHRLITGQVMVKKLELSCTE